MSDLFDDDDLFAVRPVVKAEAKRQWDEREKGFPAHTRQSFEQGTALARAIILADVDSKLAPVASFCCPCGARDEVKEPAPAHLDCWQCHGVETSARWQPLHPPPLTAGRKLTAHEAKGLRLDADRSAKQAR